eukprot:g9805.t1
MRVTRVLVAQDLCQEVATFATSVCRPDRVLRLLPGHKQDSASEKDVMSELQNLSCSAAGFVQRLTSRFPLHADLAGPATSKKKSDAAQGQSARFHLQAQQISDLCELSLECFGGSTPVPFSREAKYAADAAPLSALLSRVRELLVQFEEHPSLVAIEGLVEKMLGLKLLQTTPMTVVTMLELLLGRVTVWEEAAARHVLIDTVLPRDLTAGEMQVWLGLASASIQAATLADRSLQVATSLLSSTFSQLDRLLEGTTQAQLIAKYTAQATEVPTDELDALASSFHSVVTFVHQSEEFQSLASQAVNR